MIKASSCVCQTENVGYKSWVTYPRSHILYIEEPRFKPGATGRMLLAHGINLLSELHRWQIAWLGLEEPGLCPGTLSVSEACIPDKAKSPLVRMRGSGRDPSLGGGEDRIRAPAEGGA